MRLLVTGVTGFVGRALAAQLTTGGHSVAATYVEGRRPDLDIDVYPADLLEPESLVAAVRGFRPERIVHLAGLSHVGASFRDPERYQLVNVEGTANLVRAAAGVPITLASSSQIYGPVPEDEQPISEERAPDPDSPYARSKVDAEKLVLEADGIIVRCFNLIGVGQHETFAFPSFAAQLARIARGAAEPVLRVGNLDVRRDYLHVEDAARGYAMLAEKAGAGTIYNLGSGRAYRIGDLLARLIEISGLPVSVELDAAKFRPADAPLLEADVRRIRALGWRPEREVDEALEELWRAAAGG